LDSTVSGQGPVAGCCECGDEPAGSCATELVSLVRGKIRVLFKSMVCKFVKFKINEIIFSSNQVFQV
jgi:hypothetical protein